MTLPIEAGIGGSYSPSSTKATEPGASYVICPLSSWATTSCRHSSIALTSVLLPKEGTSLRMALSSGGVRMTLFRFSAFATSGASHNLSSGVTTRCFGLRVTFGFKMSSFSSRHLAKVFLHDRVVGLATFLERVARKKGLYGRGKLLREPFRLGQIQRIVKCSSEIPADCSHPQRRGRSHTTPTSPPAMLPTGPAVHET